MTPAVVRTVVAAMLSLAVLPSAATAANAAPAPAVAWGTTPSAPAGAMAQLFGVAAAAPDDAVAVGGYNPGAPPTAVLTRPYAEHWDGVAWSATPVPVPVRYAQQGTRLEAATAPGRADAWAVGHLDDLGSLAARTLAYHWNGSTWTRTPTPNPGGTARGNHLFDVAASTSTDVWAAGDAGYPVRSLVLHWAGVAWNQVAVPDIGTLRAVSTGTGPVAVASATKVLQRTGGGWTALPQPPVPPGSDGLFLSALTTTTAGLWAAGTWTSPYGETSLSHPYAALWDGTGWRQVTVPDLAGITGIAPADRGDVRVTSATSVLRLSPTTATLELTPVNGISQLTAIAVDPAGRSWAVGWGGSGPAIITAPGLGQGGLVVTTGYSGAQVTWLGPVTGTIAADVYGRAGVGGLPAGTYTVSATAPGCTPGTATVTVRAGVGTPVAATVHC